jgi:hypothetical protein
MKDVKKSNKNQDKTPEIVQKNDFTGKTRAGRQ